MANHHLDTVTINRRKARVILAGGAAGSVVRVSGKVGMEVGRRIHDLSGNAARVSSLFVSRT